MSQSQETTVTSAKWLGPKATSAAYFGHMMALITVFVWGTTFVSTKILLEHLSPLEILVLRFTIGFVALYLLYPRRVGFLGWKKELVMIAAGFTGITSYFLLENIALTETLASNVGVIICLSPFFTAIIGKIAGVDEKLRINFYLGLIIALAGVSLVSFGSAKATEASGFSFHLRGDFLALGAALVWAIYSHLTKIIGTYEIALLPATRRTFGYGLLMMLPLTAMDDFAISLEDVMYFEVWGNLIFLGVGASALCFAIWSFTVRTLGASRTAAWLYVVPVITLCASHLILGEPLTTANLSGCALTLIGLIIAQSKFKKHQQQKHQQQQEKQSPSTGSAS